jgi:hypothetical protein
LSSRRRPGARDGRSGRQRLHAFGRDGSIDPGNGKQACTARGIACCWSGAYLYTATRHTGVPPSLHAALRPTTSLRCMQVAAACRGHVSSSRRERTKRWCRRESRRPLGFPKRADLLMITAFESLRAGASAAGQHGNGSTSRRACPGRHCLGLGLGPWPFSPLLGKWSGQQ